MPLGGVPTARIVKLAAILAVLVLGMALTTQPSRTSGEYIVYLPGVNVSGCMRGAGDTYSRADIRTAAGVETWYNWGPTPGGSGIPMLWNASQIGAVLIGDGQWLMGFNEPDEPAQANMTPDAGARAWALVETAYPGRKLVSPGVMDLTWPSLWWSKYQQLYGHTPRVDALAVHWYYKGSGDPLATFKEQVSRAIAKASEWGVAEVWVTEFALYPCWGLDSAAFLKAAYAWLDTQPMVKRAFWFQAYMTGSESWAPGPACNSSLGNADGSLTDIGRAFKALNGSVSWDRRADITGPTGAPDGKVDILDLALVGANFGKGGAA